MGQPGLNFPADMRLSPQFGALLGARWLRVVLKPDIDLTPWIQDAHARGLKVLGVIARESLGASTPSERWTQEEWLESIRAATLPTESFELTDGLGFHDTAALYANRYGNILDAISCGNESDHVSPSSWTMTAADLNALLTAVNNNFPTDTLIIGPGLVSGDPHYLDGVDTENLCDAICVHPYGQRANNTEDWSELPGNFGSVAGLLDSYRYHGKPIWVTEVGVSTHEVSDAFQARYVESMIKALKLRTDVPVVTWFCADDAMVQKFGLYDDQGNPKPAAAAFIRVAGPIPHQEDPMAEFVLGFKDVADANSDIVGNPLEDEWGATQGISQQETDTGTLTWANLVEGQAITFKGNDGKRYLWDGSALQEVAA